jgi:MYXO-CTERM domain-containing protein
VADVCAGIACGPCETCQDGRCTPLADGAPCEDGDLCSVRDHCQAGCCQGQARVCDDGFACTLDRCNTRTGECEPGKPCADAGACDTGASGCVVLLADAGPPHPEAGAAAVPARARWPVGGGCTYGVAAGGARAPNAVWLLLVLLGITWLRRQRSANAGK